jgi:nitroreductase
MNVFTAIEARRAVKRFDPAHRLSAEETERLLAATLLSPTAFNLQHWRFVVVDDPEVRAELRAAAWMQPQITEAALLVVICADVAAWARTPERYWPTAPDDLRAGIVAAIDAHYGDRPQVQRDEAMRSCGIAAQTLMLAATALGYASCPMDLADIDQVGRIIGLPADHVVGLFVAVGRGAQEPWPRAGRLPPDAVVLRNRFPAPPATATPG